MLITLARWWREHWFSHLEVSAVLYIWPFVTDLSGKCESCWCSWNVIPVSVTPHLSPINSLLERPRFIFSYLITHIRTSHIQEQCVCLSRPCLFLCLWPVADKQRNISFVNTFGAMIFGAGLTSLFSFLFFFHCNGQPTLLGLPPTGRASRLPPDLGAVSSRPGQYLPAAKTQQMHRTQAGITISGTSIWNVLPNT